MNIYIGLGLALSFELVKNKKDTRQMSYILCVQFTLVMSRVRDPTLQPNHHTHVSKNHTDK